jgi:putative ATP-dependent endonuclease of OLD family
MYLRTLTIENFRRLLKITLEFVAELNVLVGPNNVGKTAVVEALRALLAGADDPYPRFDDSDLHVPKTEPAVGEITFRYVFADLSPEDEADFSHALKPGADGKLEAQLAVTADCDVVGTVLIAESAACLPVRFEGDEGDARVCRAHSCRWA